MAPSLELPRIRVSTAQAPLPLTPDIKNQTKTTPSSDLVPGHFSEESGKWSTVVEISSVQKSPQHLLKTFWIRKLEKESQNSASHLESCKEFFCSLPFTQTSVPACGTCTTYQTTSLSPRATLTIQKSSTQFSSPTSTWGRSGFLQLVTLFEEKWLPFSRSHTIMHYIKTTRPILSIKNTANHMRTLRIWSKLEVPRRC